MDQSPRNRSGSSDEENVFSDELYQKALNAAKVEQDRREAKRLVAAQKRDDGIQNNNHNLKKRKTTVVTQKRVEYNSQMAGVSYNIEGASSSLQNPYNNAVVITSGSHQEDKSGMNPNPKDNKEASKNE